MNTQLLISTLSSTDTQTFKSVFTFKKGQYSVGEAVGDDEGALVGFREGESVGWKLVWHSKETFMFL